MQPPAGSLRRLLVLPLIAIAPVVFSGCSTSGSPSVFGPGRSGSPAGPSSADEPKPLPPGLDPWRTDGPLAAAARQGSALSGSPFAPLAQQTGREMLNPQRRGAADGNRLAVIDRGFDALVLRLHLIRHARHTISLQTFIWHDDAVGRLLARELEAAARRGVDVRVVADHLGSSRDAGMLARVAASEPNLRFKLYRPIGSRVEFRTLTLVGQVFSGFKDLNQRMHNKQLIVDGVIGVTGGRNTANDYFSQSTHLNFRDREVLVAGPAVASMANYFEEFWAFRSCVDSGEMHDIRSLLGDALRLGKGRIPLPDESLPRAEETFDELENLATDRSFIERQFVSRMRPVARAEYISDSPGKNESSGWEGGGRLTRRLRGVLMNAGDEVLIQTPYLVLDRGDRRVLRLLRDERPGLDVLISTNSYGSTDELISYAYNLRQRRIYFEDLGLRVFEYKTDPEETAALIPRYQRLERLYREQIMGTREDPGRGPWMSIHAKTMVVDGRHTFVGSFNLDPRSANLNTEAGFLVEDRAFATEVSSLIRRDVEPGNSWVVNLKRRVPGLTEINGAFERVSERLPIELWPILGTSCFDLKPGAEPLDPNDPRFYQNYRDVGEMPGGEFRGAGGRIRVRFMKLFGRFLSPLL